MNIQRALIGILALCLITVFLVGTWLRWRDAETAPDPMPTATAAATPPSTATAAAHGVRQSSSGHRLAGTVVGDLLYAVIEDPGGASELYRTGQIVPGLGRVIRIEANRVIFENETGRVELRVSPAPAPTPGSPPEELSEEPEPPFIESSEFLRRPLLAP